MEVDRKRAGTMAESCFSALKEAGDDAHQVGRAVVPLQSSQDGSVARFDEGTLDFDERSGSGVFLCEALFNEGRKLMRSRLGRLAFPKSVLPITEPAVDFGDPGMIFSRTLERVLTIDIGRKLLGRV